MENTVVGVYDHREQAQQAMNELITAGFPRDEVELTPDYDEHVMEMPGQSIDGDQVSFGGILSWFGMTENKEHRDIYAESVRRGSCVLSVNVDNDEQLARAMEVMSRYGAVDIDERHSHWKKQGWTAYDAGAPKLSREEFEQERRSYMQSTQAQSAPTQATPAGYTGSVTGPQPGVKVFRRSMQAPAATSAMGTTAADSEPDFRQHWQTVYGQSGARYEDYDSAYRYGSTMAGTERYRNYQWADAEPELRREWEATHPESAWDKVKDAVRYGAERVKGRHGR